MITFLEIWFIVAFLLLIYAALNFEIVLTKGDAVSYPMSVVEMLITTLKGESIWQ